MVAMLIGCGLRRAELLTLRVESIQQREECRARAYAACRACVTRTDHDRDHDARNARSLNPRHVDVSSLRRCDGPRTDPLRAPAENDRARFRFVMTDDSRLTGGTPV
jgi:hypothetical protein